MDSPTASRMSAWRDAGKWRVNTSEAISAIRRGSRSSSRLSSGTKQPMAFLRRSSSKVGSVFDCLVCIAPYPSSPSRVHLAAGARMDTPGDTRVLSIPGLVERLVKGPGQGENYHWDRIEVD